MRSQIFWEMVAKVNSAFAAEYKDTMRKLVDLAAVKEGGKGLAAKKLRRKYGLTEAQIRHARDGSIKSPSAYLLWCVRQAYLDYCMRMVRALEKEIENTKAKFEDETFDDLLAEAEVLRSKVEKAKADLTS